METRASRTGALTSPFAVPDQGSGARFQIAETAWRAYP